MLYSAAEPLTRTLERAPLEDRSPENSAGRLWLVVNNGILKDLVLDNADNVVLLVAEKLRQTMSDLMPGSSR